MISNHGFSLPIPNKPPQCVYSHSNHQYEALYWIYFDELNRLYILKVIWLYVYPSAKVR